MGIANWIFRDKEYDEKIEKEIYILNKKQICSLFSDESIVQYSYSELSDKEKYLAICLENTGNKASWGILRCDIEKRFHPEISIGHLGPNMNNLYL